MNIQDGLLPTRQLTRLVHKQSLIQSFRQSGQTQSDFCRNTGVSISTLRRDLLRIQHGVDALLDKRSFRKKKGVKISDECLSFLISFQVLHPKCTLKLAWQKLRLMSDANHWEYPSYSKVVRIMRGLPVDMRTMLFENSREHFQEWGLVPRHEQSFSNQEWQMDFTEMKLWCLDTVTGELFRPYLTSIIDGHTRVCLIAMVHRAAPTTTNTLLALRSAILPKHNEAEPFFGIPQSLCTDNGSIYTKSADFMDALLRLNIIHRQIPNNSPASNGKVERFFRTFEDQLCRGLHGYSAQFRGLEKAGKTAIPFPVLQSLVDKYRMEYHTTTHRSLETTPWEKWHQELLNAQNLVFDAAEVVRACKVRRDATVERDGVSLDGPVKFTSGKLAGLVGKKVTLRLLPEGHDPAPECYFNGEHIDNLKPQGGAMLSQEITQARLERVEEIRQLRKQMKIVADKIIDPQGAVDSTTVNPGSVSSPATPEEPLGPVEKLKPTDEEE